MIAMGCVYVRKCHLNNCPVRVATTDPKWRAKFKGSADHVVNFMIGVAEEAREIMASLGVRSLSELIGRPEKYLEQREVPDHPKANTLDLSAVLCDKADDKAIRTCSQDRNDGNHKPALDLDILKDLTEHTGAAENENPTAGLMDRGPFVKTYDVVNTDRNIGTRTAGRVAEVFESWPACRKHRFNLPRFRWSVLRHFPCGGIKLTLIGEGNDYVGKGMSNGNHCRPPDTICPDFIPAKNSIVGNRLTDDGQTLFVNGRAGENSGCGTPDRRRLRRRGRPRLRIHDQRHHSNSRTTGKNFGAGMSGGTAYIYDIDGKFQSRLNREMVVARPVKRQQDIAEVKALIEKHAEKTGSPRAKELLGDWDTSLRKMIRVIAKEKYALEQAEQKHEDADGVMV